MVAVVSNPSKNSMFTLGERIELLGASLDDLDNIDLVSVVDIEIALRKPKNIEVATCGGGTGLPTQRECLEALDCYGVGKVYKFAEIVAGTVLAGEISLASAIASLDWVSSHDQLGRNDPTRG